MKRTNPGAVPRTPDARVRRIKARRILELAGSGAWEGNLAEVRGDQAAVALDGRAVFLVETTGGHDERA